MTEPSEFPFLDAIVEEIWQGKRVVLAPPGTLPFVVSNVTFVVGAALWSAAMLPRLLSPLIAHAPVAQLLGVVFSVPQIVVPAWLVARGAPRGRQLVGYVVSGWLILTAVSAAFASTLPQRTGLPGCLVATGLLGLARLLVATRSYRVFAAFQQRMRIRRMRAP